MNPYLKSNKAYKQAQVNTEDQGTLILMLYDGAIRFCRGALHKMEKKDLESVHNNLVKAKDIVAELLGSLDTESAGEVGSNLKQLYLFMYNRLIDANVQKDMDKVKEVEELLVEMREGWRHAAGLKKVSKPVVRPSRANTPSINRQG